MARGDMDPMMSYTGEEIPEEQRTLGVSDASPGANTFAGAGDFVYRFDPESGSYTIVDAPPEYQNLIGVVVSPGSRAFDSIQAEHQTGQSLYEEEVAVDPAADPVAADPAGLPGPVGMDPDQRVRAPQSQQTKGGLPLDAGGPTQVHSPAEAAEAGGPLSRLGSALMPNAATHAPERQARMDQMNAEYARAREAGEIPASLDQRIFAAVKAAFGSKKATPSAEPEEASTDSGMDSGMDSGEYGDTGG